PLSTAGQDSRWPDLCSGRPSPGTRNRSFALSDSAPHANKPMASSIRTLPSALVVLSLLCVPLLQCNHENCDRLREDLLEEKISWNECTRHEECILLGGNSHDGTGVMACNFAVHREHRLAAERRVLQLPEDTVD